MNSNIKTVGIIAMPNISLSGGFPRVARDLIVALKSLGKEVHLLTPYKIDHKKIEELHGPLKLDRIYHPSKIKKFLIKDTYFSRRFIKAEFQNLAKNVDLIIDMDGGTLHNYLPKDFDNSRYIIWRISGTDSDIGKANLLNIRNLKTELKSILKKHILKQPIPSRKHKIYPVSEWTGKEIKKVWNSNYENFYIYPEIKVQDLIKSKKKKKNQIVILGRLAPTKRIENSLRIFAQGTKTHTEYKLIILGGTTSETPEYLKYLNKLSIKLGVSKRIKIIKDPSFEKLNETLLESKVLIDSQQNVSLTMTAIEALAAGNAILAYKNAGTYVEVLERGKYGYGFLTIEEGQKNLKEILEKLEKNKLNPNNFRKRAEFFSHENFVSRIKKVIEQPSSP